MHPFPPWQWVVLLAVVASPAVGCAHKAAVPAAVRAGAAQRARIAVPCPELSARRRNTEPNRVFLEIAEVVGDGDARPLEETLRERPVMLRSTSGLLVSDHEQVSFPWRRCLDPHCRAEAESTLEAIAKLPSVPSEAIEIEVTLGSSDAIRGIRATVAAHDQLPVVVGKLLSPEGAYVSTLVVTPYLIDGQDDLRSLLACKQRVAAPP